MRENEIHIIEQPKLKNPVLIEGLPGLGLVGRIAAEHMINELHAVKFAELYSPDFPPQTAIMPDGTIKARKNEFYYYKGDESDVVILIGDDQGLTPASQYALCGSILDFAEDLNVKTIYTLGGYGMQKMIKDPRVFGAVNDKKLIKQFEKYGVEFSKVNGSIVGVAGLLLSLGELRGIKGICMMGETHGGYIDPKAAKNVLKIVCDSLGIKLDLKGLDKRAEEVEEMVKRLEAIQKAQLPEQPQPVDPSKLSYIR